MIMIVLELLVDHCCAIQDVIIIERSLKRAKVFLSII